MKYTAKFFRDNLPEWKRKKDSFVGRLLYREISFYLSAFFSNIGLTANQVSYISIFIGIIACVCFYTGSYYVAIVGAVLINIWALFDDADGNMARSVKQQPFGEFADSCSSYILVALMVTSFSFYVYFNGGIFLKPNCIWIVCLGALASNSDTLMRLIYQKYKNCESDLVNRNVLEKEFDYRMDKNSVNSFKTRIESEFGLSETMAVVILICTITKSLDILVCYYFVYYFGSCVVSVSTYIHKAIVKTNDHADVDLRKFE